MATNQTTVTVSLETTYVLPISYSAITMVAGVDQQEQLLLFRNDIDTIYGSTLSLREYKGLGQIASSWLTLNEINKQITAITIPPGSVFVMDNGSSVAYPALQAGESITVKRANIYSEPYVEWTTGSRITADQLNLNTAHLLGLIQEIKTAVDQSINRDDYDAVTNPLSENLSAGGFKITNLLDPTSAQDAATKAYIDSQISTAVTSKLGANNGIATLDATGKLTAGQAPGPIGALPGAFFFQTTAPTRGLAGDGLFKWGSLWFNSNNGRLYVYSPDDNFGGATEATDGEVGYWVDVSSPAL